MDDVARLLAAHAAKELPFSPEWEVLEAPDTAPPGVAAVDGSHAVLLDNGAAWVVAERAAAVHWPGPTPEHEIIVHASAPKDAQTLVDVAYEKLGLPAPVVRSAESFAEAMRGLHEWRCARDALKQLPSNGLLLLDGALERLPTHAQQLSNALVERASGRALVGVAKRSRLDANGTPLVQALRRLGRQAHPESPWSVPVPGHSMTYVACLHPRAKHAFRIDAVDKKSIADLIPLSRDAVYTGYPYPLAVAHNAVAIPHATGRALKEHLANAVRKEGVDVAHILDDFHDILDGNAPR